MSGRVPEKVREAVASRANHRCEYCLVHEDDMVFPYQVDHIISKKHMGNSEMTNLALACSVCNQFKGTNVATYLPPDERLTPLFNPRTQKWDAHFSVFDGEIFPKSEIGMATVQVLNLNDRDRVTLRRLLMLAKRYP
jgi:5-methylcytosine-specific restriction endonuclease McrA